MSKFTLTYRDSDGVRRSVTRGNVTDITLEVDGKQAIRRVVREAMAAPVPPQPTDYVGVRFTRYGKLYYYHCPGATVGDRVAVPPNVVNDHPTILKVAALATESRVRAILGRTQIKKATRVPRESLTQLIIDGREY